MKNYAQSLRDIVCQQCGKTCARTGNRQFFCPDCKAIRIKGAGRKYARLHPANPIKRLAYVRKRQSIAKSVGFERSADYASSLAGAMRPISMEWMIRIAMPFTIAISKNAFYKQSRERRIFVSAEAKRWKESLAWEIKASLKDRRVLRNRLWLDIFVQKPDNKSDAVNFIDAICDGVKIGCSLDDRWFSIRRVDWEIVKKNPRIFVGIAQEQDIVDVQACSHCGQLLPFENFTKKRNSLLGIDRVCRGCKKGIEVGQLVSVSAVQKAAA